MQCNSNVNSLKKETVNVWNNIRKNCNLSSKLGIIILIKYLFLKDRCDYFNLSLIKTCNHNSSNSNIKKSLKRMIINIQFLVDKPNNSYNSTN